jgi:arsenate reductase-like glutaredoxin family protein
MNDKPETNTSYSYLKDQNEKISGYRELIRSEVEAINEIKELANKTGAVIDKLMADQNTDKRLVALAKTNLQQGFMWAVRSIAKPDGF